ncbi:hypothetical protein DFH09DRAFT_1089247 [Mycena vulgaris]|nr:hypothetical protein DFH09DRAFT_1089247 [Mycena vulgaris]
MSRLKIFASPDPAYLRGRHDFGRKEGSNILTAAVPLRNIAGPVTTYATSIVCYGHPPLYRCGDPKASSPSSRSRLGLYKDPRRAISSFIVSRNVYASGDLRLPLGIWHFTCKSHVDVKRVYCRLGSIVSDSTTRNALNSMSAASFAALQESVKDTTERQGYY